MLMFTYGSFPSVTKPFNPSGKQDNEQQKKLLFVFGTHRKPIAAYAF